MARSDYLSRVSQVPNRATAGAVFSAIGGVVVLVQGLLILLYGEASTFLALESEPGPTGPFGLGMGLIGIFGIVIGMGILGGAYLIYTPGFEVIGGIVVLIFSAVSIVIGGGWLVGLGFGVLGGILGLFRK